MGVAQGGLDNRSAQGVIYSITPQSIITPGTTNGATVNRRNWDAVGFILGCATLAGTSLQLVPEDSPDGTTWTDVPAANIIDPQESDTITGDNGLIFLGYSGTQPYVRITAVRVGVGTTTGAFGLVLLTRPAHAPGPGQSPTDFLVDGATP